VGVGVGVCMRMNYWERLKNPGSLF